MNARPPVLALTSLMAILALAAPALAANLVVDTAYVAKAKETAGVVLLDTRPQRAYREEHIPGAINLGGGGAAKVLRDVVSRVLPVKTLEKILGDAGITRDHEIIVYGAKGDTGMTVAFWILEYLGAENVRAYWGGLDDWKAAKQPVTGEARTLPAAKFVARPRPDRYASTEYVRAGVAKKGTIQIVDARTPKEFAGDDIRAVRGGHIPGAVLIPFQQNWVDPDAAKKAADGGGGRDGMALKDLGALRELYKGLDPKKDVVAYCQTGTRSTQTYLVLRMLGFEKARNYDDSWIVWGSRLELPVTDVTYYDFVKVNAALKRLGALEAQVDELERAVRPRKSEAR